MVLNHNWLIHSLHVSHFDAMKDLLPMYLYYKYYSMNGVEGTFRLIQTDMAILIGLRGMNPSHPTLKEA